MAKNLVNLNINGTIYDQRPYAVCTTPRDNNTKQVNIPDFTLVDGATIIVKFVNGFNGLRSALQLNNSGVKTIYQNSTDAFAGSTNEVIMELKYDASLSNGNGGWNILNTNTLSQSDWNVEDSRSLAFIHNKPTIPTLPIWGDGLTYDSASNTLTGTSQYTLPKASSTELGGIKMGNNNTTGLTINSTSGVLSLTPNISTLLSIDL